MSGGFSYKRRDGYGSCHENDDGSMDCHFVSYDPVCQHCGGLGYTENMYGKRACHHCEKGRQFGKRYGTGVG